MSEFRDKPARSVCYEWAPVFSEMIKEFKSGKFGGKTFWGTLANGGLDIAPFNKAVSQAIRNKVEQAKQAIIKGKIVINIPDL